MRRLIFFCCATGWFFRQLSWTGAGHCFSNVLERSVTTGPLFLCFLDDIVFVAVFLAIPAKLADSFPVINICDRHIPELLQSYLGFGGVT